MEGREKKRRGVQGSREQTERGGQWREMWGHRHSSVALGPCPCGSAWQGLANSVSHTDLLGSGMRDSRTQVSHPQHC